MLSKGRLRQQYAQQGFEKKREGCEAFSVPSFPSLRIMAAHRKGHHKKVVKIFYFKSIGYKQYQLVSFKRKR